ncbi:MAG: endolytic transglycosylase MltG [Solirubrobacteraceae bacterium]
MSPSRRGDSGRYRTPEERARDRLERERRRARERGSSSPLGDPGSPPLDAEVWSDAPPVPDEVGYHPPEPEPAYGRPPPAQPDYHRPRPAPGPAEHDFGGPRPAREPAEHDYDRPPPARAEPADDRPAPADELPYPGYRDPLETYDQQVGRRPDDGGGPAPWAETGADHRDDWAETGVEHREDWAGTGVEHREDWAGTGVEHREDWAGTGVDHREDSAGTGVPGGDGWAETGVHHGDAAAEEPWAAPAPEAPVGARRAPQQSPSALTRASAALAGALARLGGKRRGEAREPGSLRGGSLPTSLRPRRTPAGGRPAASVRPRSPSVPRPKRTLSGPTAPTGRRGRIAAVVALVAVVFALWFLFSLFQPLKGGGSGSVAVDIPRGASSSTIGNLLAGRGVISSGFFFKLRATLAGKRSQLESGHFELRRDMSYGAVLDALTSRQGGAVAQQIKVTIPEGLSRTEIAAVTGRDGVTGDYVKASVHSHLLKPSAYGASSAARSLEGFLFPSTYNLLPRDPASKLVNAQLAAFKTNIAGVDLSRAKAKGLSTYDVLTIASMVEREAQIPSERPLIAAVIYNRLKSGIALGIDSTIRYAINDYSRPLTQSDLRLASPYNTRLRKGLPPTPIGNPGLASIQAAAHPAAVGYLYYVAKPGTCGQQAFSSTYTQFLRDKARYDSARAAKGGNSPTTCAH